MIVAIGGAAAALVTVSNVLPILPVVVEYTAALPDAEARRYRLNALVAGNLTALGFMVLAPPLFGALGLTVNDLRVAGGIVLLAYATHDLLFSRVKRQRHQIPDDPDVEQLGPAIAPLGIPILVGPATLSMVLVLAEAHGPVAVAIALAANVAVNAVILVVGDRLLGLVGEGTSRAVGKVMSLVLAALGAGMLRHGIAGAIAA